MTKVNEKALWFKELSGNNPLLIAGPCSAETPDQVLQIAHEIKNTATVFRAGIWKPRTRPGGFEGVGAIGLKWLQQVKAETGMLLATEVATAEHVELALAHGIDVLWIGARTTVNPFAVQEIADALQGTDKIVFIKNPVNPDLSLWIGGFERLQNAGIQKLGFIHRGFSSYEKVKYRNTPEWQIPIDLQIRFPEIPLINDPSHITGNRDLIEQVAQKALDLNFDGLMIETHCTPDLAWSDAAQQVTPAQLIAIVSNLVQRDLVNEEDSYVHEMQLFRTRIDEIDTQILRLLKDRMQIADEIGMLKKAKNVAVLQPERWQEVLIKMSREGKENKLGEAFITSLFKAIHDESITRQDHIINRK
ncbi:chorismate mutase [Flavobacterium sp. CBA20B-1]|uniref:chorismate mutase n=1 Tax=unclassified Flavobacterium TaxID=196869 RepID=UPI002225A01E|nr:MULTISPECIES: chorismate mutase [unclassified Flavobacterium]WCM42227.1 chorismate mutase [Flavobacterium sp. CBA20B-1]